MRKPSVVIGLMTHKGDYHPKMLASLDRMVAKSVKEGLSLKIAKTDGPLIAHSRNKLAEKALEFGADFLFYIDADMVFHDDMLIDLLKHDRDIIGALCVSRKPPYQPVAKLQQVDGSYKVHDGLRVADGRFYSDLDLVGTAVMLIKTSVFEKIPYPWFAMPPHDMTEKYMAMERALTKFKHGLESGFVDVKGILRDFDHDIKRLAPLTGVMGEDAYFCRLAKEHGFDLCLDASLVAGHIGDYEFTIHDYINYKEAREEQDQLKEAVA